MTEKIFYLTNNTEAHRLIHRIQHGIPCFTKVDPLEMNILRFKISCREEDMGYVIRTLKKDTQYFGPKG